ncbi:MAG: chorismate mutase [Oscillospiraceae bacterium]|nr:chorismate mutase [Oscillospiraceae bacterium]
MNENNYDLKDLRGKIDEIDDNIVKLLLNRFDVTQNVAEYKKENNLDILQQGREDEVLHNIAEKIKNSGKSEDYQKYILHIYRDILDASKMLQYKINQKNKSEELENLVLNSYKDYTIFDDGNIKKAVVGCQGVKGAYSEKAAKILFRDNKKIFFENWSNVFSAVKNGEINYGVIPLENSSAGEVKTIYNLLQNFGFYIIAGIDLPVSHCLLTKNNIDISEITDVYSHEQGLLQCKDFFEANPRIKKHISQNTAAAAKFISENDSIHYAAISSEDCAELYNLRIKIKDLQDFKNNVTRFICISRDAKIYKDSDKFTISLRIPNVSGALNKLLVKFSIFEINLTKIESHHISGSDFEFMFFIDGEGCVYNSEIKDLLCEIKNETEFFRFLGNYKCIK